MFNVVLVSLLVLLIFASIGVNYFKGGYYYCKTYFLPLDHFQPLLNAITTKWECIDAGGIWVNYILNFDNITQGMMALFVISTTAGWAELMYRAAAIKGINLAPSPLFNIYYSLFFVIFIIVGSFFILNLFVGVIISSFNNEKETYGKNFLLTEKQKKWLEAKLMIIQSKPLVKMKISNSEWRQPFFYLA